MTAKSAKTLFTGIECLLTLENASQKHGKNLKVEDLSIIGDGAILAEGEKIAWVGTKLEAQKMGYFKDPTITSVPLNVKAVLPSFLECHTHALFAGDRSQEFEQRLQGVSYQEIARQGGGIASTVRATRAASEETLLELLKARIQKFRAQGVSVVEVKTGYGLNSNEELRLLRIIKRLGDSLVVPTFLGPHSSSPEFKNLDEYLDVLCSQTLPQVKKEQLCERVDIFIEGGFYSLTQAQKYFRTARALGFQIVGHVEQLSHFGGIQVLMDHQAKSADHCVHAWPEDIENLSKTDTTAVLLPSSDFYLNISYPPARGMLDRGVRVALSTDFNPGTSPSQSVELVSVLARLQMKMALFEVICAWTIGAAYALGLESDHGSLTPGKRCNFIAFDQPWTSLFYDVGATSVKEMILNGKRVAFT